MEGQLFLSSLASHLGKESWSSSIYLEPGGELKDGNPVLKKVEQRKNPESLMAPQAWYSRLTSRLLSGEREITIL